MAGHTLIGAAEAWKYVALTLIGVFVLAAAIVFIGGLLLLRKGRALLGLEPAGDPVGDALASWGTPRSSDPGEERTWARPGAPRFEAAAAAPLPAWLETGEPCPACRSIGGHFRDCPVALEQIGSDAAGEGT